MKVLVPGGAGYIGSHTVLALLNAGHETVVVDNLQRGHKEAVLGGKFYEGDLRDSDFLDKVFSENKIDAVIDFAADSLVGESVGDPLSYYMNNVYSTLCLLSKMKEYGVKNIVFSSTAATYGEPENIPIMENDKTEPTNPYGETKLTVEKALKWCQNAYGINYVALRYFNAAGADPEGRIGELHNPETHLIPNVLKAASNNTEVSIFGNDYPTKDGTNIRDYIHVCDLSDAHVLAVEHLYKGGESKIYNLGNGNGFSNFEILETAKKVTGIEIKAKIEGRRAGDPVTLIASSEKIKRELGWEPKLNRLEDIIKTAWDFHKTHLNGY